LRLTDQPARNQGVSMDLANSEKPAADPIQPAQTRCLSRPQKQPLSVAQSLLVFRFNLPPWQASRENVQRQQPSLTLRHGQGFQLFQ
jgi:hypothetical protein